MLNQRTPSIIAILLVLLSLLLVYRYGIPTFMGSFSWAIIPLNIHQWKGIWLGAFVHGSWDHLWGNLIALAIFSALFLIQFPTQWVRFWMLQHLIASALLWSLGDVGMDASRIGSSHIGASIWVYAFGGFILTVGVMQRTKQSMAIFFLVLLIYGGFFWGLLPVDPKVSWQGHVSGLVTGVLIALWKANQWLPPQELLSESDADEEPNEDAEWEDPYENL
ncbi:MAG: rhomboid family intramembrane serine protease [Bacteroidota bacterium]